MQDKDDPEKKESPFQSFANKGEDTLPEQESATSESYSIEEISEQESRPIEQAAEGDMEIDDLDIEELDEDIQEELADELIEEGWDDLDEDIADSFDEPSTRPEKTFVQKNFKLIIAGVAIAFAGLAALNFMGGGGGDTANQNIGAVETYGEQQATPGENTAGIADSGPPMPVPIDPTTEEDLANNELLPAENPPVQPSPLTPLPDKEKLAQTRLEEFDFTSLSEENESEKKQESSDKLTDEENEKLVSDSLREPPADDMLAALKRLRQEVENSPQISEIKVSDPEKAELPGKEQEKQEVGEDESNNVQPAQQADMRAAPSQESRLVIDPGPQARDSAPRDNALAQKVTMLEEKISQTDQKLDELLASFSSLERQISSLSRTDAPEERAQTNIRQQPESRTERSPQQARPLLDNARPKPQIPPLPARVPQETVSAQARTTSATSRWVLRAAQPGRAIVAAPNSNNFKTLQIGDTLPGLGQVVSIDVENGRWIVRGTQGIIKQ